MPREERNCSRDPSVYRAGSSQGHRGQARPSSSANPMNCSASLCPGTSRTQRLSPRHPLPSTCLRVSCPPPNPLPLGTGAVQGDKDGVRATQKLSPWGGCSGGVPGGIRVGTRGRRPAWGKSRARLGSAQEEEMEPALLGEPRAAEAPQGAAGEMGPGQSSGLGAVLGSPPQTALGEEQQGGPREEAQPRGAGTRVPSRARDWGTEPRGAIRVSLPPGGQRWGRSPGRPGRRPVGIPGESAPGNGPGGGSRDPPAGRGGPGPEGFGARPREPHGGWAPGEPQGRGPALCGRPRAAQVLTGPGPPAGRRRAPPRRAAPLRGDRRRRRSLPAAPVPVGGSRTRNQVGGGGLIALTQDGGGGFAARHVAGVVVKRAAPCCGRAGGGPGPGRSAGPDVLC